jgi:molybdopterin-guanine dinucleotide biosynthesis protein A
MVPDQFPGLGALAGIHAGLAASAHQYNLIVACDMPFLSPGLLAHMAGRPRDYDVLIPRQEHGMLETLHAIYSRACLAPISEQLAAGQAKVIDFFPRVRVAYLDEPEVRRFDPALRSASNLNTPADLEQARRTPPPG